MIKRTPLRKAAQLARVKAKDSPLILPRKQDEEDEEYEEGAFMNPFEVLQMIHQHDQKELEERGIIIINNVISKETLARAFRRMMILHLDDEFTDDIQVILNSPGGYCDAGWAFIDMMGFVKNKIRTVGMGEICSMAASIFIAGDERVLSPNCSTMIHQFADYGEGKYGDLVAKGKMWDMEMNKDIAHIIRCSKYKNAAEVKKYILKDHDHWLSPQEMKKHGLCDTIFKPKPRGKKTE